MKAPDLASIEITPSDIEAIREMEPRTQAKMYDERARDKEKSGKRTFVEWGLIMVEMDTKQLYKQLLDPEGNPYRSLGMWISEAAPTSRSNAYAAKNAMEAINEEISVEDLNEIPRQNIETLKKLSTSVKKNPMVIEAAKQMSEKDFKSKIDKDHPGQHIADAPMRFKPLVGDRETIDEALAQALWAYDLEKREDAILALALYFQQGKCEREGFTQVSNKEAYAQRT